MNCFDFVYFSSCHFQRTATMAAINRWNRNLVSSCRKLMDRKDHLNVYNKAMDKWMWWVRCNIRCTYRRKRMYMRKHGVAWPRQLKIWKISGEYQRLISGNFWFFFFAHTSRICQPWHGSSNIFVSIPPFHDSQYFFLCLYNHVYFKKLLVIRSLLGLKKKKMDGEQESTDNTK